MKRLISFLLAAICILSLASCGHQTPSIEEVEQALSAGNITLKDAVDKGWVSQEWADEYLEKNSVPAASKVQSNYVENFETETLDGHSFTNEQVPDVTFFAFINPADENVADFIQVLKDSHAAVQEAGADILVCLNGEDPDGLLSDVTFPVILYNDSIAQALGQNVEMATSSAHIASWYLGGSFLSAWYTKLDTVDLGEDAKSFVKMYQDMNTDSSTQTDSASNSNAAIIMG